MQYRLYTSRELTATNDGLRVTRCLTTVMYNHLDTSDKRLLSFNTRYHRTDWLIGDRRRLIIISTRAEQREVNTEHIEH